MENPIKMDDLGVPLFLETPICHIKVYHWVLPIPTEYRVDSMKVNKKRAKVVSYLPTGMLPLRIQILLMVQKFQTTTWDGAKTL